MGHKKKDDAKVDEYIAESFPASDAPAFAGQMAVGAPAATHEEPQGEPLRIYRLVPSAEPHDPRWLGRTPPGDVIVRARSAPDARVLAAKAELDFRDVDAKPAHGVSTEFASCFRDDKLYTVIECCDDLYSRQGRREVVHANFDPLVLKL